MKNRFVFFVEGQTEISLLKALKSEKKVLGEVKVCDLKKINISKLFVIYKPENYIIFIVYDLDTLLSKQTDVDSFLRNLDQLVRSKYKFYLLQQTNNLEDELVHSCSTITDSLCLCKSFKAAGVTELKSKFIQCSNLSRKLASLNFCTDHLWCRPLDDCLEAYNKHRITFTDIQKKQK